MAKTSKISGRRLESFSLPPTRFTLRSNTISLLSAAVDKELDVREIQQQILAVFLLDQSKQLGAEFLDVRHVQYPTIHEMDDRDVTHLGKLQSPVLSHGADSLLR